ncbi:MAG: cytidylate kinase-like family protein [Pseudomonadota bacterium]
MAILSISRQFGAGGRTLGANIARALGYRFVEREIIQQVAQEANVSVERVEAMKREAGDWLLGIVSRMAAGRFIERRWADSASEFDEDKYLTFLRKIVLDLAKSGDVVIVGQGVQFILDQDPEVIKIFLTAALPDRVEFMEKNYELTKKQAEQMVSREDARRTTFLGKLDPRDPNDPNLYHLCLNTSRISLEKAEELVIDLVQAHRKV